ncbi:hypothetical protein ACHAXR_001610 [Thalassiosira sp. AJA248-18]
MDAIVQFMRNGMCTAKNFNILGDSFLYDPKVTARYYTFPSPLDQTTPLEILIAITQFYAFMSVSIAGYKMITKMGIEKLQLINRLVNLRAKDEDEKKKDTKKKDKKDDDKSEAVASRLVTTSLIEESDAATRSFIVGTNVLACGLSFFWLVANSVHVTSTDWIGGIMGLINALTVMEIALIVFLYYMVKDAGRAVRRSFRMNQFATEVAASKKLSNIENITAEQYSWLVVDGWSPFWAEGASGIVGAEEKMLTKEEESVASKLSAFLKKIDQNTVDMIRAQARISLFEGYREYVYLVLNFFAFYGYLVSILVFYYQEETAQPDYIRAMMLWMPNADADWLGNAVGDFMWTVEPILILGSPSIINVMSPKKTKEKVA